MEYTKAETKIVADFEKLIKEAKNIFESSWKGKKILMFHNVSEKIWHIHKKFIKFVKTIDSDEKFDFGISSHNLKESKKYLQCEEYVWIRCSSHVGSRIIS